MSFDPNYLRLEILDEFEFFNGCVKPRGVYDPTDLRPSTESGGLEALRRAYRERHVEKGLCIYCTRHALVNKGKVKKYCVYHRAQAIKRVKEYQARNREEFLASRRARRKAKSHKKGKKDVSDVNDKYKGWIIAVISVNGPQTVAYLGKITADNGDGEVALSEIVELRTALVNNNGQMQTVRNGLPAMFFESLTRVVCRPISVFDLDKLSDSDVAMIDILIKECEATRTSLHPVSGGLVQPVRETITPEMLRKITSGRLG